MTLMPRIVSASLLAIATAASPLCAQEKSPLTLDMGNGITVKLYGYLKADFTWDNNFDLGYSTAAIKNIGLPDGPIPGSANHQFMRESRIGFEVRRGDLLGRFEGDFFGQYGHLRLRLAYVEWPAILIGQNWTNYMSVAALPPTVDFQGSGAQPFARVPQVRYSHDLNDEITLSASIEQDVSNEDDIALTAASNWNFDPGMLRLSGIYRDAEISGNTVEGWGLAASTVLDLWRGGTFKGTLTTGSGTADILAAGLTGQSLYLDGQTVDYWSGMISLSQQVTDRLMLAVTTDLVQLDEAVGTDTKDLQTWHLSAFYTLRENTVVMAEWYTGRRTQANGIAFDNQRVQLAIKYSF